MTSTTSFLDLLKKEDALIKEKDRVFDTKVARLYELDAVERYPKSNAACATLDDLRAEVQDLDRKEIKLNDEIKAVRRDLLKYASRILSKQIG